MCKLSAIVEIENQNNAERFAKKAIPIITATDNHGLGVFRLGENGVHVQRWLEPPKVLRSKKSRALLKYAKALRRQQNEAGRRSASLYALAIHGRFATCAKVLENVHPFYRDGTALAHNGIVHNPEKYDRPLSSCDSEALLTQYLDHKVKDTAGNLTAALDGVGGYYAAIVFNDNGIIDIWRDDTATLFIAHVRSVGVVIATTAEIITKTARRCGVYISELDEILPYTAIRWKKGRAPSIIQFEGRKPVVAPSLVPAGGVSYQPDIIEAHKSDVSDAHWWDGEYEKEERRVTDWKAQEDANDAKSLEALWGTNKGAASV